MAGTTGCGHLFVLRGDLTKLACDAWLLPTDECLQIEHPWSGVLQSGRDVPCLTSQLEELRAGRSNQLYVPQPLKEWRNDRGRVLRLRDWPQCLPEPWLTNVGGSSETPAEWYSEGVRQFLDAVRQNPPQSRFGRERPLIALPVVGTRMGGAAKKPAEVIHRLLPILDEGRRMGLDIALVTFGSTFFSAAQAARSGDAWWPSLDDRLREAARTIAEHASDGRLAVFLGAGASVSAGLPTWSDLLDKLAGCAPLPISTDQLNRLKTLDYLDRATLIAKRFGNPGEVQQAIKKELKKRRHYSLIHGLLASSPIREVITTNYDCLFETACARR